MDLTNPVMLESLSNSIVQPSLSHPLKNVYRAEPMALGQITQILIGILETAFGLVVVLAQPHYFHSDHGTTPYWLAFLYIISGSLSVAAAKNPKLPIVKGMLGMNIVSAVAAGIGSVILFFTVVHSTYSSIYVRNSDTLPPELYHELDIFHAIMRSVWVILLVFSILEFFIAITTAGFGCASVCRNSYSETTVVIYQNTASLEGPPVVPASVKEDEVP